MNEIDTLRAINAELLAALRAFADPWDAGRKFADMDADEIELIRSKARRAIARAVIS